VCVHNVGYFVIRLVFRMPDDGQSPKNPSNSECNNLYCHSGGGRLQCSPDYRMY
jgi:hypothetical protein